MQFSSLLSLWVCAYTSLGAGQVGGGETTHMGSMCVRKVCGTDPHYRRMKGQGRVRYHLVCCSPGDSVLSK